MQPRRASSASRRTLNALHAATVVFACLLPSCVGTIGDAEGEPAGLTVPMQSAFPRLTHAQWENTTRDLLRLDTPSGLSASFTSDPLGGVFDNDESVLDVTP